MILVVQFQLGLPLGEVLVEVAKICLRTVLIDLIHGQWPHASSGPVSLRVPAIRPASKHHSPLRSLWLTCNDQFGAIPMAHFCWDCVAMSQTLCPTCITGRIAIVHKEGNAEL